MCVCARACEGVRVCPCVCARTRVRGLVITYLGLRDVLAQIELERVVYGHRHALRDVRDADVFLQALRGWHGCREGEGGGGVGE